MIKNQISELIFYSKGKVITAQELLQKEYGRRVPIDEVVDICRRNLFVKRFTSYAKKHKYAQ